MDSGHLQSHFRLIEFMRLLMCAIHAGPGRDAAFELFPPDLSNLLAANVVLGPAAVELAWLLENTGKTDAWELPCPALMSLAD